MQIELNGKPYEAPPDISVTELLETLGLGAASIAAAVNGAVVPRGEHAEKRLRPGDVIEIIQAVAGG